MITLVSAGQFKISGETVETGLKIIVNIDNSIQSMIIDCKTFKSFIAWFEKNFKELNYNNTGSFPESKIKAIEGINENGRKVLRKIKFKKVDSIGNILFIIHRGLAHPKTCVSFVLGVNEIDKLKININKLYNSCC